jgi:phenylpyruvate tautomerase PptA (4-oxalocrotonate tautomerase family)
MPFIHVHTSEAVDAACGAELAAGLSRVVAEGIGKPEQYVMAAVSGESQMVISGQTGPAAFVDVRSIGGLSAEVNGGLTRKICALLEETLGIPGDRVYMNFTDVARSDWGWNGQTFG